jgi:hypothetical protein
MFRGCFYNDATQQEINENTHFKEHGKHYFGRHYEESAIRTESDTQGLRLQSSVLLLGNSLAIPPPLLCTIGSNHGGPIISVPLVMLPPAQ